MMTRGLRLFVLASGLTLTGCTYHSDLDQVSIASSAAGVADVEPAPLSVAIVNDAALQALKFSARSEGYGVEIALGDYFAEAMRIELTPYFSEVAVVDNEEAAKSYDLKGQVDAQWEELSRSRDGRSLDFEFTAIMRFANANSGQAIAEFSSTEEVTYDAPGALIATSAIDGLTLGLAMPLTTIARTQMIGGEAERVLRQTISRTVGGIGPGLADHPNLVAYVAALSGQAPSRQSGVDYLPSRYDPMLDAVVVLSNAAGIGSGFFVTSDGYLITNAHVVEDGEEIAVTLRDGRVLIGRIVAEHQAYDLALVKITGDNFSTLRLGSLDDVEVGNDVIALGTPLGLSWTLTKGIVSATRPLDHGWLVQTDAAINQGNSGGPLIDEASGRVIGVNTLAISKNIAEGLNFAVAADQILTLYGGYIAQ